MLDSPFSLWYAIQALDAVGSMVKWLRHRPLTAVTGVQIPLESLGFSKIYFIIIVYKIWDYIFLKPFNFRLIFFSKCYIIVMLMAT